MSQILTSLSYWLHSLATVIFIGYYVLVSLIFLPVLSRNGNGSMLSETSKRSRPWMYASLIIFIVTGIILMLVDPEYLGVGNFSNVWGVLMLVKHILILGMIAMGFWFNAILRIGPPMSSNTGTAQAVARFRQYVNLMAISGVLFLLLTAIAQVE
jgi:uncharacterized membrane protein